MKQILIISALIFGLVAGFTGCKNNTDDDKAQPMIETVEAAVAKGDYKSALDSIVILRNRFPKAIKTRQRALELWQEASLLQAQHEVAVTDSALQATIAAIDNAETLLEQNILRNKRDSLQARYDAECGVVRIIRAKQKGDVPQTPSNTKGE